MNVRHVLFALNAVGILVLAGFLIWAVLNPRRARDEGERTPANETEFLDDDALEGRRLERVLGWSLLFGVTIAVALPLYWLREPVRQEESEEYFDHGAVERGETLFANSTMEAYDSVLSLQCATCHGADAGGGFRAAIIDLDGPAENSDPPRSYNWKVPPLNTALLRFTEDPECAEPPEQRPSDAQCEVTNIITYGRPGTPMPAFGVAGGGAENEQTISDVVAYLRSIQLTPDEAKEQAAEQLAAAKEADDQRVTDAEKAVDAAETALDTARTTLRETLGLANADDTALQAACEDLETALTENPETVTPEERSACNDYVDAVEARDTAQANLDWAETWRDARTDVKDGQYLFELFCARCHTQGWSTFDPANPDTREILGLPGGGGGQGGGIGPNLRDGGPIRRFGNGDDGELAQTGFVSNGSDAFVAYGNGGIGSGKMPGFGSMLSADQIAAIVEYERTGLDDTTYPEPEDLG